MRHSKAEQSASVIHVNTLSVVAKPAAEIFTPVPFSSDACFSALLGRPFQMFWGAKLWNGFDHGSTKPKLSQPKVGEDRNIFS